MPAAGVGAVATIAVAHMQKTAADKRARLEANTNEQALKYAHEQDASRQAASDREWADYEKRYAEWKERNFPGSGGGGGSPAAQSDISRGGYSVVRPGASVADMIEGVGSQPAADVNAGQGEPMSMNGASLADLAQWSDHKKYLQA